MRLHQSPITLSAADLSNHLGCRHLTTLDLAVAHNTLAPPPHYNDPALDSLIERGFEHERQYIDHLRAANLRITTASATETTTAAEATLTALRHGPDVITQATLIRGPWYGRADVLLRTNTPSALGPYSYEVVDTKLAAHTKAATILQLCLYSDLLAELQGLLPEHMHVVSPGTDFTPETFRVADGLAYYRWVKARLEATVQQQPDSHQQTYPEPVEKCDTCRWWIQCGKRRRDDDHLSLVAGMSTSQRVEAGHFELSTLAQLAKFPVPLQQRPQRGSAEAFERVREQARVQLAGREASAPVHEVLPVNPERGLARLPEPSAGDIFFDIEAARFFGDGGLEYLLGWTVAEGDDLHYEARWADDRDQERAAFEAFVDAVMARWDEHPGLHIYHYAPYEPVALKRLMGRHATREDEVDRMLRAELFVDLYAVARNAVRASVEKYSIKDLEQFYGYARDVDLRVASKHRQVLERALEVGQPRAGDGVRAVVEGYNRDDCVSTYHLRQWLEQLRAEAIAAGATIVRPEVKAGDASEQVTEQQAAVQALAARLLAEIPGERAERGGEQQAQWLLAHVLDWYRRESKVKTWEGFRLAELDAEDLLYEKAAVSGLEFVERVGVEKRSRIDRYRFPPQETSIDKRASLKTIGGKSAGTLHALDLIAGTLDIKRGLKAEELHPEAVYGHTHIPTDGHAAALLRLGEWVADNGIDAPGDHRAARDLLLRRPPRGVECGINGLQHADESSVDAARRVGLALNHGLLAVQGPPGVGKTYAGARMICELVRAGKKVGVVGTSHKVILKLLEETLDAATDERIPLRALRKISGDPNPDAKVPETKDNAEVLRALEAGEVDVAAGTSWLWTRDEFTGAIDVLVIDEAGQMSLADVLAVSQSTTNLVLLGDPQQLEQPVQGSHPEGTEVSALEHMLAGHKTMPATQGLFLPQTRRLHPAICTLTSELFYDGRLTTMPGLETQALVGDTPLRGAGLWFAPVSHTGNQNHSHEEVERVCELYDALTTGDVSWVNEHGDQAPLTANEILIVAPYNAQVSAIAARLPEEARVGTVDKFQGQEAPITIYSLTTSSQQDAPRGMEFLFSLNRLNVASSRARCACVLVGSPRLFEADCKTPRQVQLANAFCRYVELATELG